MGTQTSWKIERDENTGREIRFYRDSEEPEYMFLALKGIPFEITGAVNLRSEYPSSIRMSFTKEKAHELGLDEDGVEFLEASPAQITLKFPEEWARRLLYD
jgi:hypothetical protein